MSHDLGEVHGKPTLASARVKSCSDVEHFCHLSLSVFEGSVLLIPTALLDVTRLHALCAG